MNVPKKKKNSTSKISRNVFTCEKISYCSVSRDNNNPKTNPAVVSGMFKRENNHKAPNKAAKVNNDSSSRENLVISNAFFKSVANTKYAPIPKTPTFKNSK